MKVTNAISPFVLPLLAHSCTDKLPQKENYHRPGI